MGEFSPFNQILLSLVDIVNHLFMKSNKIIKCNKLVCRA